MVTMAMFDLSAMVEKILNKNVKPYTLIPSSDFPTLPCHLSNRSLIYDHQPYYVSNLRLPDHKDSPPVSGLSWLVCLQNLNLQNI